MSQSDPFTRRDRRDRQTPEPCRPVFQSDLVQDLLTWVFPVSCLGCQRALDRPPPMGLCIRCRGRLKGLVGPRCPTCGDEVDAAVLASVSRCRACRERPPAFDRLLSAWSYEPPLDAVVRGLKFARLDYLGPPLGEAVADRLSPALEGFDVVTPVPLHWRRQWRRGFNQAEQIAVGLARRRHTPLRLLLRRCRATAAQSGLPRPKRLLNPRDSFRCRRGPGLGGLAILLVDDVATTGATLEAAARCLRKTGAERVTAVTVGRTPTAPRTGGEAFLTV